MELNFGSSGGNFFMVISQIPGMIALETLGGITTGRSLAHLTAGRLAKDRDSTQKCSGRVFERYGLIPAVERSFPVRQVEIGDFQKHGRVMVTCVCSK
jgi:hypothetical protein